MIDNATQVERLLPRLQAALPLPAQLTPEATAMIRKQKGFPYNPSHLRDRLDKLRRRRRRHPVPA
jgi:hypothetical protein